MEGFSFTKRNKTFFLFSLVAKMKRSKRETKKRPELGSRLRNSWKDGTNSLRSDNIPSFSSKNYTSSEDPLVRNVFILLKAER